MRINCQCYSAKVAPNTNRPNFAGNYLEYDKLKASTQTLHVTNRKACSHLMYKLCVSKLRDDFRNFQYLAISEIDLYYSDVV